MKTGLLKVFEKLEVRQFDEKRFLMEIEWIH